jgi:acyl phosphate:glycerol-3-phosphate acyltransferase
LLGSINTAIIVCRSMGLADPRTEGSLNPGATNVLRLAGKQAALIVLIADALKGFIPVLLAKLFGLHGITVGLVAVAALLGHLYPIFFQFKGGKGFATALGGIFGLSFFVGVIALLTWGLVVYLSRYSSLGALVTMLLLPVYILIFSSAAYLLPVLIMSVLVIWRHWTNVERLRSGTETKIVM